MLNYVKKAVFYIFVILLFLGAQFFLHPGLATGKPPLITQKTLSGHEVMPILKNGPVVMYFWAEWCGICERMSASMNAVFDDVESVTIAIKSGDDSAIRQYLQQRSLQWQVVNDEQGRIAEAYGVRGVPAIFIVDEDGLLVWPASGYSSEWGVRVRLWLSRVF